MRVLAVVVTISCARSAPPPAASLGNVAAENEPSLDALAFLTGCWTYYHIDYGFDLCWERRAEGWHGRWHTKGPMATERTITLDITRGRGLLELTAEPSVDWFDGVEHVALTGTAPSSVRFGHGDRRIAWSLDASTDELRLAIGEQRPLSYVMLRFAN
jgi:hypothetical protein